MRPNWVKFRFSRDILEAKFDQQGYNPLVEQHITSNDVITGIEPHIDQNFTRCDHLSKNTPQNTHFDPFFDNREVKISKMWMKTFQTITFPYDLTISGLEMGCGVRNRKIITKNLKFSHFSPKIHQKNSN